MSDLRVDTALLILPEKRHAYPLNPLALTQSDSPRLRLANDYRSALLLTRKGELRRIDRIEVLGPWGSSGGRRLLSRLTGALRIATHLSSPLPLHVPELKALLAECIAANGELGFPDLDDIGARERVAAAVLAATTVEEIFSALPMPALADALDVL